MTFVRIQSLTQSFRAVEVFIRDKYERKKYYDQEALAAASTEGLPVHDDSFPPLTHPVQFNYKQICEKEHF
ncbi:hypothetical protein CHARACLAT_029486 [Characodon lateralis]|uniref:Uncharacterized protein n=1 Tax=Characodon lateralis TaxID=208331 RepID=A0ABU7F918_9TELE|nr:hypothetical protein [Characodon lateralis]